jgi:bifunctional non-homologous end joining protein LigD
MNKKRKLQQRPGNRRSWLEAECLKVAQRTDFVEPCLPSPVDRPPVGRDWIHEIKHDGFRLLTRRGVSGVRLFTRNGYDWTERFPLIVEALNALRATTCLVDGEAITCNEAGLSEFEGLL